MFLFEFQTIKAFLPSMLANNHGHIVSINSVLGLMGASGTTEYCASKFGALGLYEALSVEVARECKNGVFLTTVHPYHVDTSMFAGIKTRCVTLARPILHFLSSSFIFTADNSSITLWPGLVEKIF